MKFGKILVILLFLACIAGCAQASEFVHDENGELVSHNFPAVPAPVVEYDQWGNVSRRYELYFKNTMDTYTAWEYDENRTLLKETRQNPDGSTVQWTYEYDDHGFPLQTTLLSGEVVKYANEYDAQGRILSSTSSSGTVINYEHAEDGSYKAVYDYGAIQEYGSDGLMDREVLSDGTVRNYDDRGNLISVLSSDGYQDEFYTYSEDGALLQYTIQWADSATVFDIDAQGCLVRAASTYAGNDAWNETLEYNQEGVVIRREKEGGILQFRDDATVSRGDNPDGSYEIHNQFGRVQKKAQVDGSCYIYYYNENGQYFGHARFEADGTRGYNEIKYDNIGFDAEGCLYVKGEDEDGNTVYAVYTYDADGALLSWEVLPEDQYTPS